MRIAIIGAGAGVGLLTVAQALERGHEVIALSPDTATIPDHPMLTKVNGSATSVGDLKKVMLQADVVLITVGTKSKKKTTLFSQIAKALIAAADELNFSSPVLIITGFGTGESARYLSFFMRTVIRFFLKDQYADKTLMEELIFRSSINWHFVRPGMLTNGHLTKRYKVLNLLTKGVHVGKISRADVADYLVTSVENRTNLKTAVALTY